MITHRGHLIYKLLVETTSFRSKAVHAKLRADWNQLKHLR